MTKIKENFAQLPIMMVVNMVESAKNFCSVFAEHDYSIGELVFSPQKNPLCIDGNFLITGQLLDWYQHVLMNGQPAVGGVFAFQLIGWGELCSIHQGWRWVTSNGVAIPNAAWKKEWVIFGERNGDVFFADTSSQECPVFFSVQQVNKKISGSLSSFLDIVSTCMLVELREFGCEVQDDDFNFKDGFIDRVSVIASKAEDVDGGSFINSFFG